MNMNSIHKAGLSTLAAAFVFAAVTAIAAPLVHESTAQLKADKAALQRQIKRLDADEARLNSDTASGRMSAESKDAYDVYKDQQAVTSERKVIGTDKSASLQMKSDRAALERQIKRLHVAEARLKADGKEGKMAAESKDAEKVYEDKQAIKGEKKDIAADKK